jgi:hypothetical protein
MTPVSSLPLSCTRTEHADHGIRRRVPCEISDTRRQGRRTRDWPRVAERSVADLSERTLIATTAPIEAGRSVLLCALLTADPREQLP